MGKLKEQKVKEYESHFQDGVITVVHTPKFSDAIYCWALKCAVQNCEWHEKETKEMYNKRLQAFAKMMLDNLKQLRYDYGYMD